MSPFLAGMITGIISLESLFFVSLDEQSTVTDCAQAVVESISAHYWGYPINAPRSSEEGDFSMSVAEIVALLSDNGLEVGAFWIEWDQLLTLVEEYGPVITHLEKPLGHFAVTVAPVRDGDEVELLVLADPARGLIAVDRGWWKRHASGATIVADVRPDRTTVEAQAILVTARYRRMEAARAYLR